MSLPRVRTSTLDTPQHHMLRHTATLTRMQPPKAMTRTWRGVQPPDSDCPALLHEQRPAKPLLRRPAFRALTWSNVQIKRPYPEWKVTVTVTEPALATTADPSLRRTFGAFPRSSRKASCRARGESHKCPRQIIIHADTACSRTTQRQRYRRPPREACAHAPRQGEMHRTCQLVRTSGASGTTRDKRNTLRS